MFTGKAQDVYKRNTRVFYFTEFFNSLIFTVPIWVIYELQFLTLAQLMTVEAIIFGLQLVLELPTGAFADLVGRKWSVLLGCFMQLCGLIVFGISTSYAGFIVYGLFVGLAESLVSGAKEALLYDTLKEAGKEESYDKLYSKYGLIFQLGLASSILIGGLLGQISIMIPIYLTSAGVLLKLLAVCFLKEPFIDSEKFTFARYVSQTKLGFKELWVTAYSRRMSLFYILVGGITWACQMTFNNVYMVSLQFSALQLGVILATLRLTNSLVLFKLLNFSQFLTKKRAFLFFPLLMIVSYLPGFWLHKWIAIPFVAGSILASTARWIVLAKYTNQTFSSARRATAISALNMGITLLYIGLLAISGPLTERWRPGGLFTFLGVLSIIFVLPLGWHLAHSYSHEYRADSAA